VRVMVSLFFPSFLPQKAEMEEFRVSLPSAGFGFSA
jgi:hypothetical protein